MTTQRYVASRLADTEHILKNLQDYARAVKLLTWQRQGIIASVALLTGWFFSPWRAELFFAVGMICEYVDLTLARKVDRIASDNRQAMRYAFAGFIGNTIVSASAISIYAIWVGQTEDGVGLFTALFCLFSAALYAAINNHQIVIALAIRLVVYGTSFIVITVTDLLVDHPPFTPEPWLQFFTVIFAMYFVTDCSLCFLRLYRRDLKRLEDLQVEHARTKAALVVKSQFVAVVSHELRTPLTSIKGSLDLVNSRKFGDVPPKVEKLLEVAGRNTQRLAALVNDLLDMQKLEEGQMKFEKETVELGAFITDAIESHQGLAKGYNVRLVADKVIGRRVYADTDRSRLMQVVGNLISNAAKFSRADGDVDIWLVADRGRARISVRDHGIGIPNGVKDQVFGRFTQIDSSEQRKFGGTGLGLNISREIIEVLGGTIDYESTLSVGTTFFIEVPCHEVDQADQISSSDWQRAIPAQ